MIEFKTIYWGILGIFALALWALEYFHLFKKPELFLPVKNNPHSFFHNPLRLIIFFIGIFGWALISLSLMRPLELLKNSKEEIEVNDIFLVVDVSRSMLAEDFSPNRLEVTKRKILQFVDLQPSERIGIIAFSEQVLTLLPLTIDLNLVRAMVSEINIGQLGSGTNIGDAVALAVARLSQSSTKRKVIILFTDGVSQVDSITPLEASNIAKEKGIKIYTIAVGSDENAKIPIFDSLFGKRYQNIPGGSIDVKTLSEMARITNGRSYEAKNEGALSEILTEIEKLEKTKILSKDKIIFKEYYFEFLIWGVIALFFAEFSRKLILKEII